MPSSRISNSLPRKNSLDNRCSSEKLSNRQTDQRDHRKDCIWKHMTQQNHRFRNSSRPRSGDIRLTEFFQKCRSDLPRVTADHRNRERNCRKHDSTKIIRADHAKPFQANCKHIHQLTLPSGRMFPITLCLILLLDQILTHNNPSSQSHQVFVRQFV